MPGARVYRQLSTPPIQSSAPNRRDSARNYIDNTFLYRVVGYLTNLGPVEHEQQAEGLQIYIFQDVPRDCSAVIGYLFEVLHSTFTFTL
jgi:hypothetical protein